MHLRKMDAGILAPPARSILFQKTKEASTKPTLSGDAAATFLPATERDSMRRIRLLRTEAIAKSCVCHASFTPGLPIRIVLYPFFRPAFLEIDATKWSYFEATRCQSQSSLAQRKMRMTHNGGRTERKESKRLLRPGAHYLL